jgi:cell division protein FtsL
MAGAGAPAIEWAPRVQYRPRRRWARSGTPLIQRVVAYVRALPDHSLLDRIVRGRTWIAVLGVMLVGIVAMQVEMLKLGASIGRSISQTATLQSKNEMLRASVAALSDDQRIEKLAAHQGMVMPGPTQIAFVPAAGRLQQALTNIHAPAASTFVAASATAGGIATNADTGSYSASPQASYTP